MRPRVLIADDDRGVRFTVREILEDAGLEAAEAADGAEALARLERGGVDLVLADQRMPGLDGLALLEALRGLADAPPLVLLTAHGSERLAVEAMKRGAADYLPKPFDPEELALVVERHLERARLDLENRRLRAELALSRHMIFRSGAMQRVALLIERVARRDTTVLISGETGTGKELVARALVAASSRADRPYVRFNCGALPAELAEAELFGHAKGAFTGAHQPRTGVIRQAAGGTLLLDEVGELALGVQVKLLRFLQEGEVRPVGSDRPVVVDVRVLAATHRDLEAEVAAGRFREDLYYRLNVVPIRVPPLRERPEDIAPLAEHFARRFADRFGMERLTVAPALLARLSAASWPGNVRELENALERLVALTSGPVLDDDGLAPALADASPAGHTEGLPLKERVEAFERGLVASAFEAAGRNQSEAARRLGVNRPTLIGKLKKYGLVQDGEAEG